MKNCSPAIGPPPIDRRSVSCSLGALAISVVLARLPYGVEQSSKMAAADQQFLIINGWVLTREDMAESAVTVNVF